MNIQCNGEPRTVDEQSTLHDLLLSMQLEAGTFVAEVNGKIIEQDAFAGHNLNQDDHIELIRFVGGG